MALLRPCRPYHKCVTTVSRILTFLCKGKNEHRVLPSF